MPRVTEMIKARKIYGMIDWDDNGEEFYHRQKESFNTSFIADYSDTEQGLRKLAVINADLTGTNMYSIIIVERETEELCDDEIEGQLSDGVFENCRTWDGEELPKLDAELWYDRVKKYRNEII